MPDLCPPKEWAFPRHQAYIWNEGAYILNKGLIKVHITIYLLWWSVSLKVFSESVLKNMLSCEREERYLPLVLTPLQTMKSMQPLKVIYHPSGSLHPACRSEGSSSPTLRVFVCVLYSTLQCACETSTLCHHHFIQLFARGDEDDWEDEEEEEKKKKELQKEIGGEAGGGVCKSSCCDVMRGCERVRLCERDHCVASILSWLCPFMLRPHVFCCSCEGERLRVHRCLSVHLACRVSDMCLEEK